MGVFLFYQPGIPDGIHQLTPDESRHCVRVLRKRNGDEIRLTDGKGTFYDGVITEADVSACAFAIREQQEIPRQRGYTHVAISPTKNLDRIEWFVEKATEIGVDKITLMHCRNTERNSAKTDRLVRVAISAMKQSMKAWLPEIVPGVMPFEEIVRQTEEVGRYIAHVDASNALHLRDVITPGASCAVLVGPEGDFSTDELQTARARGFLPVSLGRSRLRTETAGVVACHVVRLVNE